MAVAWSYGVTAPAWSTIDCARAWIRASTAGLRYVDAGRAANCRTQFGYEVPAALSCASVAVEYCTATLYAPVDVGGDSVDSRSIDMSWSNVSFLKGTGNAEDSRSTHRSSSG